MSLLSKRLKDDREEIQPVHISFLLLTVFPVVTQKKKKCLPNSIDIYSINSKPYWNHGIRPGEECGPFGLNLGDNNGTINVCICQGRMEGPCIIRRERPAMGKDAGMAP